MLRGLYAGQYGVVLLFVPQQKWRSGSAGYKLTALISFPILASAWITEYDGDGVQIRLYWFTTVYGCAMQAFGMYYSCPCGACCDKQC